MLVVFLLAAFSVGAPEDPVDPMLVGLRSMPERGEALKRNGGSSKTEKAVQAGLDWLERHQGPSGGWDADGFARHCEEGVDPCEGVGKGQHGESVPCPFDQAISALAAKSSFS